MSKLTTVLLIIGGLNMLFIPFGINLIEKVSSALTLPALVNIAYIVIGLAAVYKIVE
jgi:uncharacterized membrane protein YuzA (DUF378 family)